MSEVGNFLIGVSVLLSSFFASLLGHTPSLPQPSEASSTATSVSASHANTQQITWTDIADDKASLYSERNGSIFYKNSALVDAADPDSFEVAAGSSYAKDAHYVYFANNEIDGSDPSSLVLFADSKGPTLYAKDLNNAYYAGTVIPGAEVNTFELVKDGQGIATGFARDDNQVYFDGLHFSNNPITFELIDNADGSWTGYAKDSAHTYSPAGSGFDDSPLNQTIPVTTQKPPVSLQSTNGISFDDWQWYPLGTSFDADLDYYISYTVTGGRVYFILPTREGTLFTSNDPSTFEFAFSLSEGVSLNYGRDKSSVYYQNMKISGADPTSFTPILDYQGHLSQFAKDTHAVYCNDVQVVGADPQTFVAEPGFNSSLGADYAHTYNCTQIVK